MDSCGFHLVTALVDGRAAGEQSLGAAANASRVKAWVSASEAVSQARQCPTTTPRRVKALAREGIPPTMRPSLWHSLSGGAKLQEAGGQGRYAELAARHAGPAPPDAPPDAWAVLPGHPALSTVAGAAATRRLALTIAGERGMLHTPRAVRVLAAFLLAVMGLEREEEAFWTLAGLLAHRLPPGFYDGDMAGAQIEQAVMDALIASRRASVWARLAVDGTGATSAVDREWGAYLFITVLPADTAARVFDSLMVEGAKVLHRVGLALCTLHSGAVLACASDRAAPAVLRWRVAHTHDADALMRVAFRGVGTLSRAGLASERDVQARAAAAASRGAAARLARLVAGPSSAFPAAGSPSASSAGVATPDPSVDSGGSGMSPPRTQTAALRLLLSRPALMASVAARVA